jgi:hypothetical protein
MFFEILQQVDHTHPGVNLNSFSRLYTDLILTTAAAKSTKRFSISILIVFYLLIRI